MAPGELRAFLLCVERLSCIKTFPETYFLMRSHIRFVMPERLPHRSFSGLTLLS